MIDDKNQTTMVHIELYNFPSLFI